MTGIWLLLFIGAVVALVALLRRGAQEADAFDRAEQRAPSSLDGAFVVEPGTKLSMRKPFALYGTPDVVYRTATGTLVVREDKSGFPHPLADRIQVSVYAAILRHNPPPSLRGMPVEPYGWIRYGIPGRSHVRWERVDLLTDDQLQRVIDRYQAILRKERAGGRTADKGYCAKVCRHFGTRCDGPNVAKCPP